MKALHFEEFLEKRAADRYFRQQIQEFLEIHHYTYCRNYRRRYPGGNYRRTDYFKYVLENFDAPKKEIARKFGVSISRVAQWENYLIRRLRNYLILEDLK